MVVGEGASANREALIGKTLGSYRVLSVLGEGGMGCVYLAEHAVIGRKSAIKVLSSEVAGSDEVVSRFFTEARAVNDIRHPNIVEITDFGRHEAQPYLVMEYLEGETLESRLEHTKVLSEAVAGRIVGQVASALGAAHERGLVHRDLKPANIFLRHHPDYPDFVKVLDFGIAKLVGGDVAKLSHRTQMGAMLGTPAYMSPEQCLGDVKLDHRSDVYSLGVVLYLMVTGRLPFLEETLGRLIMAHVHEAPEPPSAINPQVTPAMSALIMRALEKKPESRFGSMREMRDALAADSGLTPAPMPAPPQVTVSSMGADRTVLAGITPSAPLMASSSLAGTPVGPTSDTLRIRLTEIVRTKVTGGQLELPTLSSATIRCLELVRSAGFSFAGVAAVLSEDARLSSQIVQRVSGTMVSPAALGPARAQGSNLEKAIAKLGAQGLRAALIEIAARPVYQMRQPRVEEAFRKPWAHALAVGMIAERLAELRAPSDGDSIDAFGAGLLLDSGRIIVATMLLDIERQMTAARGRRFMNDELWMACVAQTHAGVGALLARRWRFSEAAAAAIETVVDESGAGWTLRETLRMSSALAALEGFYLRRDEVARAADTVEAGRRHLRADQSAVERAIRGVKETVLKRA